MPARSLVLPLLIASLALVGLGFGRGHPPGTWNPRHSNLKQHPSAPLYSAGGGSWVPLVEVSFPQQPGEPPRRFVIDTGAADSALTGELARTLELEVQQLEGPGGATSPWVELPAASVGDALLERVPLRVVEALPAVGHFRAPVPVDGVLGMNVLSHLALDLRPDVGLVSFHPSGHPLVGTPLRLGEAPDQVLAAGAVGGAPPPPGAPRLGGKAPTPASSDPSLTEGVPEDAAWAPIIARTDRVEEATLDDGPAPPTLTAEERQRLPTGGPHLLRLATGAESTRVHPDVLPWAGGDGVIARVPQPASRSLNDALLADLMDELPPRDVLQEVTRYRLPWLALGSMAVSDLELDLPTSPWVDGVTAAVIGADILRHFSVSIDVGRRVATLRPGTGQDGRRPIAERTLAQAEAALSSERGGYRALEEGLKGYVRAGRWPEAAAVAGKMVDRNPSAVEAYVVLARRAERLQEWQNGAALYKRIGRLQGGELVSAVGLARLALLQSDSSGALLVLGQVSAPGDVNRSRLWRIRGQALLAAEYFGDAQQAFSQALRDGHEDAGARRGLAWIEYRAGDLEKARQHLDALLAITPGDEWAQALMIAIYRRDQDEAGIDTWLDRLAGSWPDPAVDGWDPLGHVRARLLRERGEATRLRRLLDEQQRALVQAAGSAPTVQAQAEVVRSHARLLLAARTDLPAALELAERAVQLDPYGRAGTQVRVACLRALGRPEAATAARDAWSAAPLDLAAWLLAGGFEMPEPPAAPRKAPPPRKPTRPARATSLPRR